MPYHTGRDVTALKLGLVYAMPSELEGILRAYGNPAPELVAGIPFYSLTPNVIACAGGVGKVNAAIAAALLCREWGVTLLCNAGVAGCLTDLPTGTLVVASHCVQHDVDTSLAGDPEGWVSTVNRREFPMHEPGALCARLRAGGFSPVPGVVATGDWFGRDFDRARHIRGVFDALVCDMEACAVAQTACRLQVPVMVLKTVSDHLFSQRQDTEYAAGLVPAAQTLTDAVLYLLHTLEKEREPMERIASFTVDHTVLQPGLYLSRQDGDVVTYDLRMKKPNTGDLLTNSQLHSTEHLIATLLRNSPQGGSIVYFGPMGCQTGFYLLVDGKALTHQAVIELLGQVFAAGAVFGGEMPGYSAVECGNYRNLDLDAAREVCREYARIILDWTPEQLAYA